MNAWIENLFSAPSWTSFFGFLHLAIAIPSAGHALLNKENERAAVGWIGVILLSPYLGCLLYWLFGVNRIRRRAKKLRKREGRNHFREQTLSKNSENLPVNWQLLVRLGMAIHNNDYASGNTITPLVNGDEAYPAMLAAIRAAEKSIVLSSYIFDYDRSGREFVRALIDAHKRGVDVRVLLDGVGMSYSWIPTDWSLKRAGIKTARFLPKLSFKTIRFLNLRNHRKMLIVDGTTAFTGGINIRHDNVLKNKPRRGIQDLHFKIEGPVIDQLRDIFAEDWEFAAREKVTLPGWTGSLAGNTMARAIPDGPDEDYQRLEWTLLGAIRTAERSVRIVTPYFLPDMVLTYALKGAGLRGLDVEILLPEESDIPFISWAMQANFPKYLEYGIKLYRGAPPFDHSKLLLIDDLYCLIGSSNWDTRSMELNFEANVECLDKDLNAVLSDIFENKKKKANPVTEKDCATSLPVRLRNNFIRLFSPYL